MKSKSLILSVFTFILIGAIAGFSYYDILPQKNSSKSNSPLQSVNRISKESKTPVAPMVTVNSDAAVIYSDDFDGLNDTTSLKSRGYKVWYRGGGAQASATWFQGNNLVFNAYNGPTTGYVGANYQVVSGTNNIQSWLVLPKLNVGINDSLYFYSRSPTGSTFPDSIRVVYSSVGDSVPEAASWVELGKFKVNTAGVWELKGFKPNAAGANARYAIKYQVVNGGPSGLNSDFIGIDALTVGGQPPPPPVDIAAVNAVYALGLKPIFCYDTNKITVNISHMRAQTDVINVNWTIKDVNGYVRYTYNDVLTMTGIGDTVYGHNYIKTDSLTADSIIVTATATGEEVTTNNSGTYISVNTPSTYSYLIYSDFIDGGVGFTDGTGDFVAGFSTDCSLPITAVDYSFINSAGDGNQPYNVLIFADAGGVPGTLLYTSPNLTTPPGNDTAIQLVTHYPATPVNVGPGKFYIGLAQTGTINLSFSFQDESPIRANTFFFRAPTTWTDFSDAGAEFRLHISPRTSLNLNLTALVQGFYYGANLNISDTLTVELRDVNYALVGSAKGVNGTNGNLSVSFNADGFDAYYIVVKSRNGLEIWSTLGEFFAPNPLSYDFTTAASQAAGSNQILNLGEYCIYSGDVNQDQTIDAGDLALVENANGVSGYVPEDVNGDDFVDSSDLAIVENNKDLGVNVIIP